MTHTGDTHGGFLTVTNSEQERVRNFFADPRQYLRNNPYVDIRADAVRRFVPRRPDMSILDLGCGDGRLSIPLVTESGELLLVDSSAGMLDIARNSVSSDVADRVRFECVDLSDFEPRQKYDVVLCIGVLAHVQSPTAILRQIADLVGPKGCAIIQITDDDYFLGRFTHRVGAFRRRFIDSSAHKLNHMTLGSLREQLHQLGLEFSSSFRYIFIPGLRRLPVAVTRSIVRSLNGPILSQRGGEVLALFTRS